MSDYEIFMIILTTASLIVSILTYTHKKNPPCSLVKNRRLRLNSTYLPGRGTLTSLTGCLDKYIICQSPEFVNFHLPTLSSAAASPIQFIGILLSISFMLFHTVHCFVIIVYFLYSTLPYTNILLHCFHPFSPCFMPVLWANKTFHAVHCIYRIASSRFLQSW